MINFDKPFLFLFFTLASANAQQEEIHNPICIRIINENNQNIHIQNNSFSCVIANKLSKWIKMNKSDKYSFSEIIFFIKENPDWPNIDLLFKKAEQKIHEETSSDSILSWFEDKMPQTTKGAFQYATLLKANYSEENHKKYLKVVSYTWKNFDFPSHKEEDEFIKCHGAYLQPSDHFFRIERLQHQKKYKDAQRLMSFLSGEHNHVVMLRDKIINWKKDLNLLISNIHNKNIIHPSISFEIASYFRIKKEFGTAAKYLNTNYFEGYEFNEYVWKERARVARELLDIDKPQLAYQVASRHYLDHSMHAKDYIDAEWLCGWILAAYLKDYTKAIVHFNNLFQVSKKPISQARAAYWLGICYENVNPALAEDWFKVASQHQSTFYGQLGLIKLSQDFNIESVSNSEQFQKFLFHPLIQGLHLIYKTPHGDLAHAFIRHLPSVFKTAEQHKYLLSFAAQIQNKPACVFFARHINTGGSHVLSEGYPLLDKTNFIVDSALVHAIIRQESTFQQNAISPAGAMGFMQLMPATAADMAKKAKITFKKDKLLTEPSVNILLGQMYLKRLLLKYNGSLILSIAAYNAGETNIDKWVKLHGYPSLKENEWIYWIEKIPFMETRNYVQRVLEGFFIYRKKIQRKKLELKITT